MSLTLTQVLTRTRDMLDEATASRWTDTQLRRWVNDCLDDMARRTYSIKGDVTLTSVASQAEYTVTSSVLKIYHVYWTDGGGNLVPLTPIQWDNADNIWGSNQNQTSSNPSVYSIWGYAPNLKLRLYPVPNVSSRNIVLKVAKLPTHVDETGAGDASTVDFPEGWVTALIHYCEMRALRKDRDERWKEASALYNSEVDSLAQHDSMYAAREMVFDPAVVGGVPRWLADPLY